MRKWTKDQCVKEARKYKRKVDWRFGHPKSYAAAAYNKWLPSCYKHMMSSDRAYKIGNETKKKWNLERCHKEALKYDSRANWYYSSHGGYAAAMRNGWTDQCCGHMLSNEESRARGRLKYSYTKEECINISKKFKTKTDWLTECPGSYSAAKNFGIHEECSSHMENSFKLISQSNTKNSKEDCIKAALKYKTRTEWARRDPSTYDSARRKGWLNICRNMP